jgi:hypothetical protein
MILYLINDDYIVKITDFNGTSITGMEYAQTSDPSTWYTFTSVALEAPSGADVNNGYGWATHKFVGFGENGTGNNMIFFSDAFGTGSGNPIGSSISFHGLALSGDWGTLYYDTTLSTAEVAINLLGAGLAHNYTMDSDMGDSVSFHNGTYNGASFSSDAGRNHISFDGVDDFATITDTANLAGDQWTISAWIKTSVTSGRQEFFSQWYDPSNNPSIGIGTADGVLKAYYRGHNTGAVGQLTGPNIANGEWRHISYVKDGTAVKLYVDGLLVASSAFSGTIDSTSDIFLGVWDGSIRGYAKDHYFTGGMDNLMIHTRGLSADEVAELHTSTIVTVPASVAVDQDPSSVSVGDVMTATVDLQGGTLGYFAWEQYDAVNDSWTVVAGGSNSVVDMTVSESMSEATMKVSMEVDSQWYFSADMSMPVLDVNAGLIAKYALDTDASDSAGSNNLSLIGGTVSYGAQDGHSAAAGFSSGELRSDATIDLTGEFTVSFWAKEGTPYTYSGNNYSSFFRWGTTTGSYFDFYLLNGKIRSLHNNATSGWGDNRGTVSVPAGWNHYAMTIDPASGEKIIYLNGVAQVLTGAAFTGAFAAPQKVFLGNTSHGNAAFRLNGGKMDDTRIWDRVLSATEIAGLHAAGAEEPPAAPIMVNGYYPLYLAESDANGHDGGDGSSHSHVFDGVTHYMPDGLVMGVTQFHGTYGIEARYPMDIDDGMDTLVGSDNGTYSGDVQFDTLKSREGMIISQDSAVASIPDTLNIGSGPYTINVWVHPENFDQTGTMITDHVTGSIYPSFHMVYAQTTGKIVVYHRSANSSPYQMFTSTGGLTLNQWQLVTVTWDGSTMKVYFDGALDSQGSITNTTWTSTVDYRVGSDTYAGIYVRGMLDDLTIHDREMPASEVAYWHTETTVTHTPSTPSNDVTLSVFTADAWGDTWNGNVLNILDENGAVVATSNGPASGVKAPAGLTESVSVPDGKPYTWTLGGGNYMNEVQFSITHSDGTVLVNVANGQTTSAGSFTVGVQAGVPATVAGVVDSFQNDSITLSVSMNETGQAAASGWSYRLDDGYVVGQTHGGTVVAMGQPATISVTPGETTIYVASIDSNANVLAVNSITQNTVVVSIAINKFDSYGDGWNGAAFTMTDSNGTVVVDETLTSGGKPGPVTVNVQLAVGTYDYALSAGSYPGELSMTVVNVDSSETIIDIPTGQAPASGQIIITPPQASVTLSATSGFEAIYVSATPNQQALDDGATQWALLGSDTFGDVGTTIDPAIPLSDLANMAYIYTSTEDALTGYAAIVDSSGLILAKSSVSGQAMINQLPVGQEMVLMAVLAPMFLDDQNILAGAGTIPSTLVDDANLSNTWQLGPFYLGDLQVSSYGTITTDFANDYDTVGGLLIPTVFDDGMGGTGSADLVGKMVKDLIRKLDLHQLDGDLAPFATIFQSVLDGSDKDAIKLIDPEESSLMMKLSGGGYVESSQYKFCQQVGELGIGEGIRNMVIPDQVLLLDVRSDSWGDGVDPSAIKGTLAPADSVISGQASVFSGEVTMSVSVGEFAQAQGAVGWVYLLDQSVGDVGQTTSETVISLGSDTVFTPSPAGYTAYVAAVDASGVIMATDSFVFDTTPMRLVKWKWYANDWSGLNGGRMTLTDSLGNETISPVVSYDTNGAWHEGDIFELREDVYSWAVNEHSIRASDQGHLKLVEVDSQGAEIREIIYVWALSTRMHKDGTSWPNQEFSGQFALPEDTVVPVLTLLGDASMTVYTGGQFVDPGYSVSDNLDPAPVVTVSGHESIAVSEAWIASTPQDGAPVINGDLLTFDNSNWFDHTVHKSTNIPSSEEAWEVVVEFDNYSAYNNHSYNALDLRLFNTSGVGYLNVYLGNAGGLGAHAGYKDGDNMQQQAFAPIGLISSGALKIARENGNFKFYYSLDKVSFTLIQQFPVTTADVLGNVFGTDDLQISLRAKDAAVDVTDFSRTDMPYGAQQGNYTITYSASDFSGNVHALQRTVSVVPETYLWHHGNQLTDIVKYLHGYDADGERSHMYLKDDDGLTVLYFTPDLETFASFTAYGVDQHFIEGAPVCAAYGAAGQVLLGTETGCLYMIELGTSSVPTSFTKVHDNGGMRINQVHFGVTSNAWLIEYNEEVYTMPAEGGILTMRMTIPAGSFVQDFAQADDATSIIIRKADYSFATYIAMPEFATIHDESAMRAIFSSLGATNVDYNYALDKWTAADSDYNVIETDQIIDWLLS